MSLGGSAQACSLRPRPANPTDCPPTTPRSLRAYQRFVRAELVRYRNVVDYWESWLEPNDKSFWPSAPNPQQYANLLRAQDQVFQRSTASTTPHLKLLFAGPVSFSIIPGSPGGMPVLPFVNQVLSDLHGARVFDAIGLHAYRFPSASNGPRSARLGQRRRNRDYVGARRPFPGQGCNAAQVVPDELAAGTRGLRAGVREPGYGQMPLWLTEFGWPGNAHAAGPLLPVLRHPGRRTSPGLQRHPRPAVHPGRVLFNLRDYQPGLSQPGPGVLLPLRAAPVRLRAEAGGPGVRAARAGKSRALGPSRRPPSTERRSHPR